MRTAFPSSDYYEASVPSRDHQPTSGLPVTALEGPQGGQPRTVPTFTRSRSTREMPSYAPAASPQVRRRLSPWPPRRPIHSGYGVARPVSTAGVHGIPTQIRQVRVGSTLTELHALVPLVHLLVLLAGPAPSGSARASRRCQDCSRPPRRLPDQAVLSFAGLLRQPSGQGLSPQLGTLAPRGARTGHRTDDEDLRWPNGAAWPGSPVPGVPPRSGHTPVRRCSPAITSWPSSPSAADLLSPFAMHVPLARSDYYGDSATS